MKTNLHSMMAVKRTLPSHAFHPNASLMAAGSRNCYVSYPFTTQVTKANDSKAQN